MKSLKSLKSLKSVKIAIALMVAGLVVVTSPAHALRQYITNITSIESTYLPGLIRFSLSTGPVCSNGLYDWNKGLENNKVTYAGMLAAMLSGKSVVIYFNDNDNCLAQFIHFQNQ
jgi:hypothetical protein